MSYPRGTVPVLAAVTVAAVVVAFMRTPPTPLPACQGCSQAVTSATYFALMQVDCDNSYEMNAPCQDDLENVNVSPTVHSITVLPTGNILVWVSILARGPVEYGFKVTVTPAGRIIEVQQV